MQGIILAAGMGKRLKELTRNNTKCMVKVNGISIIERTLKILDKKGLSKIVIVVGYESDSLIKFIDTLNICTPIKYIENQIYNKTNNIYSLALAKDYLCTEDTILLESDIVFEEKIIDDLMADKRSNLALVDKFESWMDGTCLELDNNDGIMNFIPGKYIQFSEVDNYYKTVNIYKFSKDFSKNIYVPFLLAYKQAMGDNEYYESVIKLIAMLESKDIRAKRLTGETWYEIDNIQDLNIAETLFAEKDTKYSSITKRYGGFWRYPKLLDFCYLVNPYYPPAKMIEEIKGNVDVLLTEYPSGMSVNSLLASGAFGVNTEHIVIGNGAAELISSLIRVLFPGEIIYTVGGVRPTFEEYPNRMKNAVIDYYVPNTNGYKYTVNDIINYYNNKKIDLMVLVNPDNPTGNYLKYDDVLELVAWCKDKSIDIIVDESFVDFSNSAVRLGIDKVTMIKENILCDFENLYVIKSISKSYGVPGARLGIMASGNVNIINSVKKDVPIWNINSFAEFYMQIREKYEKDYINSLRRIDDARSKLFEGLNNIEYLEVYSSDANYFMCKVNGIKSSMLCDYLMENNIIIKDLTDKINDGNQYIRIAVRDEKDNSILLNVLKGLMLEGN